MRYKYPDTQDLLGKTPEEKFRVEIEHLEKQLEAAYWASGKWTTQSYQEWMVSLDTASTKTLA